MTVVATVVVKLPDVNDVSTALSVAAIPVIVNVPGTPSLGAIVYLVSSPEVAVVAAIIASASVASAGSVVITTSRVPPTVTDVVLAGVLMIPVALFDSSA